MFKHYRFKQFLTFDLNTLIASIEAQYAIPIFDWA